MSVLLSIKPRFVDEIAKGAKLYEFRKAIFKRDVEFIWVYASAPKKRIVGKLIIDHIIEDSPQRLWENFHSVSGIDKKGFFEYFSGKDKGYAIKIKQYIEFDEPINPYTRNPNFTPPQSYAYLDNILPEIA